MGCFNTYQALLGYFQPLDNDSHDHRERSKGGENRFRLTIERCDSEEIFEMRDPMRHVTYHHAISILFQLTVNCFLRVRHGAVWIDTWCFGPLSSEKNRVSVVVQITLLRILHYVRHLTRRTDAPVIRRRVHRIRTVTVVRRHEPSLLRRRCAHFAVDSRILSPVHSLPDGVRKQVGIPRSRNTTTVCVLDNDFLTVDDYAAIRFRLSDIRESKAVSV